MGIQTIEPYPYFKKNRRLVDIRRTAGKLANQMLQTPPEFFKVDGSEEIHKKILEQIDSINEKLDMVIFANDDSKLKPKS